MTCSPSWPQAELEAPADGPGAWCDQGPVLTDRALVNAGQPFCLTIFSGPGFCTEPNGENSTNIDWL